MVYSYPVATIYNSAYAVRPDNEPGSTFTLNPAIGHELAAICVFGDYHCMASFSASTVIFRYSIDAGATWTNKGYIGTLFSGSPVALSGFTYGTTDRLICAYRSYPYGTCDYGVAYSDDMGDTWHHTLLYGGSGPSSGLMDMSVDRTTGTVHVTYCRLGPTFYHIMSHDGGETWESPSAIPFIFPEASFTGGRAPIAAMYPYVFACTGYSSIVGTTRYVYLQAAYSSDNGQSWGTWTNIALPPAYEWSRAQGLWRGWLRFTCCSISSGGLIIAYANESSGYISDDYTVGPFSYRISPPDGWTLNHHTTFPVPSGYRRLEGHTWCAPYWDDSRWTGYADHPYGSFAIQGLRNTSTGAWLTKQWVHDGNGIVDPSPLEVGGSGSACAGIYDGPAYSPGNRAFWW